MGKPSFDRRFTLLKAACNILMRNSLKCMLHHMCPAEMLASDSASCECVYAVALNPQGSLLAAGCTSGAIRISDTRSQAVLFSLKGHTENVRYPTGPTGMRDWLTEHVPSVSEVRPLGLCCPPCRTMPMLSSRCAGIQFGLPCAPMAPSAPQNCITMLSCALRKPA